MIYVLNEPFTFAVWALTGLFSVLVFTLLVHLAHHEDSRLWPRTLKHRWILGILSTGMIFANFVLPFALIGDPLTLMASLVLASLVLASFGRHLLRMIFIDLKAHWADGRNLVGHSIRCVLFEEERRYPIF